MIGVAKMDIDNAYDAIVEVNDVRWAFGTGFTEPLSADAEVPAGVDCAALATYCLMLGDDALIMSHRLQEWCTRAPELEDEVALANIGLDLLGHARLFLSRAGVTDGMGRSEDDFAFHRDESEFRNVRLVELERGDFAHEIARLLIFSTWRLSLFDRLTASRDPIIAAIAAKGVKEVAYHRDYAAGWAVRLGDGTAESRRRMASGLRACWPYVAELFTPHRVELAMAEAGIGVDPAGLREEFDGVIGHVLSAATLETPSEQPAPVPDLGRSGVHTAAMSALLSELQGVARQYPGATW